MQGVLLPHPCTASHSIFPHYWCLQDSDCSDSTIETWLLTVTLSLHTYIHEALWKVALSLDVHPSLPFPKLVDSVLESVRIIIIIIIMNISPRKLIQEPQMRSCSSQCLEQFSKWVRTQKWIFHPSGKFIPDCWTTDLEWPRSKCNCSGSWNIQLPWGGRSQLSPTGYRRNYNAVGCQIRRCQSIQTSVHQSGDLENYLLSHWQPMKAAQHWRDVIILPSTSDEPCCRVLDTLQASQEFPADTVQ